METGAALCPIVGIVQNDIDIPGSAITTTRMLNKDRPTDVTCFIFCSTCFEC